VSPTEQRKPGLRERLRAKLNGRRQRRAERARIRAEIERERERRGEVGRYGVGDNTGYGGSGI
jgi:hypothetical protein